MSMRFGAGYLGHVSTAVTVDQIVATAQRCEAAGLDSFWVADQRWMRDVYVTLGALAASTRRMQLGTRVTDAYVRHPALTAAAIATLDDASHGRAVLGLGAGGSGFRQMGIDRKSPLTAIREAVGIIRGLWRGDDATHAGSVVNWGGGNLHFGSRPDIPITIAARGPRLLELAGEIADGAILAVGASVDAIHWARRLVAAGEQRANREPGTTELAHMTYLSIADNDAEARAAARHAVVGVVLGSYPRLDFLEPHGIEAPKELLDYLGGGGRDRDRVRELISKEMVDKLTVSGTPTAVMRRFEELHDAGIEHFTLAPVGADGSSAERSLHRFLNDVLPPLQERQPRPTSRTASVTQ